MVLLGSSTGAKAPRTGVTMHTQLYLWPTRRPQCSVSGAPVQWLGTDCPPRVIDFSPLGDGNMKNPFKRGDCAHWLTNNNINMQYRPLWTLLLATCTRGNNSSCGNWTRGHVACLGRYRHVVTWRAWADTAGVIVTHSTYFIKPWSLSLLSCIYHESLGLLSRNPALIWIVLLYREAKIKHLNIRAAPRDSDKWCHGAGRFQWTSYKYITNTAPSILHFLYQLHLPPSQLPPTTFCPPVSSWI